MSPNPWTHYRNVYEVHGNHHLIELVRLIPHLSYADRKKLMSVARARCFPKPNTVLYQQTWPVLKRLISLDSRLEQQLRGAVATPMFAGFFLSCLLSAPYESSDVRAIKKELMWKEISVMESIPRKPTIDWMALLSYFGPLHDRFRESPATNRRVRISLRQWVRRCQSQVIYPSMGNKSVSFSTRCSLEYEIQSQLPQDLDVTSTVIEYHYSRTGSKLQGACEMKQKWYPTQASPRTYFAQGGTAYHTSKFLRDPFNWLCDSFYPTNRYTRVSPSGITVDTETEDVYVYDLTSFTSLFHEHRAFLHFLAVLTEEETITIFDSWEGPLIMSLGALIWQYLETNVLQPSYDTKIQPLSCLELHHSIAGFLGVFGNLATCTYPHGVCLSTVYDKPDDCWCAGDDAGSKEENETEGSQVFSVADVLGSIAKEKTYRASQEGALALKRPISIHGGILYLHPNILWPIFSVMIDEDPRYNLLPVKHTIDRITGAIVSFFQSCQRVPLSSSDIQFAYEFFSHIYQRFSLPTAGWYPPLTGYYPWHVTIPRLDLGVFGKDPLHVLVDSFFGTEYTSIVQDKIPWDQVLPVLNGSFVCNSEKHLAFLERLGYLMKEPLICVFPGLEGRSRAHLDIEGKNSRLNVYSFTVIESIPDSLVAFALGEL